MTSRDGFVATHLDPDATVILDAADALDARLFHSAGTISHPVENTDMAPFEQQFEPPMCESRLPGHEHTHEAAWWAQPSCGNPASAICNERRIRSSIVDGWWCIPGCDGYHADADITFTPVKP